MKDGEKRQEKIGKTEEPDPDPGNVLQPTWIRRLVRGCDEVDRIFLANRSHFLFHISFIFWIVVLLTSKTQR